jgi:1-acyl-sn-glycerol-3-phosphate acyltransferase
MALSSSYSGFVMRVYRWIWLGRIRSQRPEIPRGALVLAAHYNGLVDGFVYGSQLPPARAIISVQWHRTFLGRALFPGIAVQRAKDAGKGGDNLHAFREMTAALAAGERLLFFPEGTSRLGRKRLPIARGTLLLLKSVRRCQPPPPVYFCAACYHSPTRWRSHVTVGWTGPVPLPASAADDEPWVMKHLLDAQSAAYAPPAPRVVGLTPLAALMAAPYLPLWAAVSRAAHRAADDDNVISLWKFLFGVPATALALAIYTGLAAWAGLPLWLPFALLVAGGLLWNQ